MNNNKLVPEQSVGNSLDLEKYIDCSSNDEAKVLYRLALERLRSPDTWHTLPGAGSARFKLINQNAINTTGKPENIFATKAREGDFIRIDIPGPGTEQGHGYDYVQIVKVIEEQHEDTNTATAGMRVHPCSDPTTVTTKTAHFFDEQSSSSFQLSLNGKKVTARYYGRNERINSDNIGLLDKVRNIFVGAGARAGLSKNQWSFFLKGLLARA